jgi:integrase
MLKMRVVATRPRRGIRVLIFNDLIREFEAGHLPKLALPTRLKYQSLLHCHIAKDLGHLEITDLTTRAMDTWLEAKKDAGLSTATRTTLKNLVHSIFVRADAWGIYEGKDPTNHATVGRHRPLYERRKLTTQETVDLLRRMPEDARIICMVALFCGLRISEVMGLCWKHVDFERGRLIIRQRYYRGDLDMVKSPKSVRDIPFGDLAPILRSKYPGTHAHEQFCFSVKTQLGKTETRNDGIIRKYFLRKAAEELGLYRPGFGFHDLRREAVTAISSDIGAIQACLFAGHTHVKTTLLYGLSDYLLQKGAVERMQSPYSDLLGILSRKDDLEYLT